MVSYGSLLFSITPCFIGQNRKTANDNDCPRTETGYFYVKLCEMIINNTRFIAFTTLNSLIDGMEKTRDVTHADVYGEFKNQYIDVPIIQYYNVSEFSRHSHSSKMVVITCIPTEMNALISKPIKKSRL